MKKSWPLMLVFAGLFLVLFGFALATSGGALTGVVIFGIGLTGFLIGSVAATLRFAVRRRLIPHLFCGLAALVLLVFALNRYCFSLAYLRGAQEDPGQLWLSALKPFTGQVYYVGSEGDFSYFRAGALFPARYKALTSRIGLPRTFPLGSQEPYTVTEEMVYYR